VKNSKEHHTVRGDRTIGGCLERTSVKRKLVEGEGAERTWLHTPGKGMRTKEDAINYRGGKEVREMSPVKRIKKPPVKEKTGLTSAERWGSQGRAVARIIDKKGGAKTRKWGYASSGHRRKEQ